jgi:hypothetical protein
MPWDKGWHNQCENNAAEKLEALVACAEFHIDVSHNSGIDFVGWYKEPLVIIEYKHDLHRNRWSREAAIREVTSTFDIGLLYEEHGIDIEYNPDLGFILGPTHGYRVSKRTGMIGGTWSYERIALKISSLIEKILCQEKEELLKTVAWG